MSYERKIHKPAGQTADALEIQVAKNIAELEQNSADLKGNLNGLQFTSAKEVDVGHGKKAIIIFVPVPLLKQFQRIHSNLVRELEKKFSDRHILLVAQRRILKKPSRTARVGQLRPRSRTLTMVHENWLEDLVYPTEIVGKRTKISVDGKKVIKVFLDKKDHASLEYKLDTFSSAYKKLTGKEVTFEFPVSQE